MSHTPPPEFRDHLSDVGECWEWTSARVRSGYGVAYVSGRQVPAHRVTYEAMIGPIPDGLDLDHLCRNRACVNPSHLEPVTRRENLLRSPITVTARKAAQSECVHGHEFTPENTIIRKADGTRHCRACKRLDDQAYRARRRKRVA